MNKDGFEGCFLLEGFGGGVKVEMCPYRNMGGVQEWGGGIMTDPEGGKTPLLK